jgi:hypothetical protein
LFFNGSPDAWDFSATKHLRFFVVFESQTSDFPFENLISILIFLEWLLLFFWQGITPHILLNNLPFFSTLSHIDKKNDNLHSRN